jgi:hypothetical protein
MGLPEFSALYLASDGLCLPHWRAMHTCRPSAAVSEQVSGKQRKVLASLKAALNTIFTDGAGTQSGRDASEQDTICAAALAAVAGDTQWKPSRKSVQPAR